LQEEEKERERELVRLRNEQDRRQEALEEAESTDIEVIRRELLLDGRRRAPLCSECANFHSTKTSCAQAKATKRYNAKKKLERAARKRRER